MKQLSLILLTVLVSSILPYGDMDISNTIDSTDFTLCMQIASGQLQPNNWQKIVGDLTGDGRINSADCAIIHREYAYPHHAYLPIVSR